VHPFTANSFGVPGDMGGAPNVTVQASGTAFFPRRVADASIQLLTAPQGNASGNQNGTNLTVVLPIGGEPPDDTAELVGGIVGALLALLLLICCACFAFRSRIKQALGEKLKGGPGARRLSVAFSSTEEAGAFIEGLKAFEPDASPSNNRNTVIVPVEPPNTYPKTRRRSSFTDLYMSTEAKGTPPKIDASICFEPPTPDLAQKLFAVETVNFEELDVEDGPVLAHGSLRATWRRPGQPEHLKMTVLVMPVRAGQTVASKVRMFERLGRSKHPHICRLLATTVKPKTDEECMVMEFAERGSLEEVLRDMSRDEEQKQRPSNSVLLAVASQVCQAMEQLHKQVGL
jgi:serine/threonine protein kinase